MNYISKFFGYTGEGVAGSFGFDYVGNGKLQEQTGKVFRFGDNYLALEPKSMTYGKTLGTAAGGAAIGFGLSLLGGMEVGEAANAAIGSALLTNMIFNLPRFGLKEGKSTGWNNVKNIATTSGIPLLASAYFVNEGYQQNGLRGAANAIIFDVATNAAVTHSSYLKINAEPRMGATQFASRLGTVSRLGRFVTAGVGASIGGAIGDTLPIPGAGIVGQFLGAHLGATPLRSAGALLNPYTAAIAVGALTAGAVGYGTYEVLKMGHAFKQSKKGIQTAGELSAFMTGNAQTTRARAVQAIQRSHMNGRSALGREANFMHYPSRNYHSPYRM